MLFRSLIDLMERGYVSALAMNGAGVIHDFEIALSGATSEDVEEALGPGRFGMAEETGRLLNDAIRQSAEQGLGLQVGELADADVEQLPQRAQAYLNFLEEKTGVEIGGVSTGPERNETIIRPGSKLAQLVG